MNGQKSNSLRSFELNTTLESIVSTIESDKEVSDWFWYFLSVSKVSEEFSNESKFKESYLGLCYKRKFHHIAQWFLIAISFYSLFYLNGYFLLFLIPLAVALFVHKRQIQKQVGMVSGIILKRDFDLNSFEDKSLYQICDYYSDLYNVDTFVKFQYYVVNFLRVFLIVSVLFPILFVSTSVLKHFLFMGMIFYAAKVMVGYQCIFDRLK